MDRSMGQSIIVIFAIIHSLLLYTYVSGEGTCISVESQTPIGSNDAIISCPGNYSMVSCGYKTLIESTVITQGSMIDHYNSTCIAPNTNNTSEKTIAIARCCELPLELECNGGTNYSNGTVGPNRIKKSVSCEPEEQLLSCNVFNPNGTQTYGSYPFNNRDVFIPAAFGNPIVYPEEFDATRICTAEAGAGFSPQANCCAKTEGTMLECTTVVDREGSQRSSSVKCTDVPIDDSFLMISCAGLTTTDIIKYVDILFCKMWFKCNDLL